MSPNGIEPLSVARLASSELKPSGSGPASSCPSRSTAAIAVAASLRFPHRESTHALTRRSIGSPFSSSRGNRSSQVSTVECRPAFTESRPCGCDHLAGVRERAGLDRVMDRLVHRAVIAMPGKGPAVKRRREAGLAVLELDPQELGEEMVEAVPLAEIVERQEEQVRSRERGQPPVGAFLFDHRVT